MLFCNFQKKFPNFSLEIEFKSDEKLLAIIGKSGSGKTTFLRCLSGLETIDKGEIKVDNKNWENLSPQKRDVSVLFQHYALFPNMSVFQNLKFALNNKHKIEEIIEIMELKGVENRYPNSLSGGAKQRVALGRALLTNPKILLLDEPFSALNYQLKEKLYKEIELIKQKFDTKIILISHDKSEVFRLADRVIEIDNGKIVNDFIPNVKKVGKIISKSENKMIVECGGEVYQLNL